MGAVIAGDPAVDFDFTVVLLPFIPTAGSVLVLSVVLAFLLDFTTAPVVRLDSTALTPVKDLVDGRGTVVELAVFFFTAMLTILSYRRFNYICTRN